MKEPVPSALRRIDHTLRVSSQAKTDRDYDLCPGVSGVWGSWILREAEVRPLLPEGSEERGGLVGMSEAPDSVEICRRWLASWDRFLAGPVEGVPSDNDPTPVETQAFPSSNSVTYGPSRIVTSEIGVLTESSEQSDRDAALRRLIGRWVAIAMSHVTVSEIDDPEGYLSGVAGIRGAWGFGTSPAEAVADLESVLIDWVSLKLEDGDDDIPSMEGVHLVLDR